MPCATVCGAANMGNVGGRAETDGAVHPPHFCPAAQCQGRTSPDPSGVRPVPSHSCCCQERGHRLVKEEVVLEGGRVHGLTQAAWLEPGHPHSFQYSLSHWSHLPYRRFTTALPGRAPMGRSPLHSWPERLKVAGAQPSLFQGLVGHQLSATSLPSSGHGQGNGGKSQRWP